MSFMNGVPLIATAEHVSLRWSGSPKNFRCGFCGSPIKKGELWCFVHTNDMRLAGGNPLACHTCLQAAGWPESNVATVNDALRERWRQACAEFHEFVDNPRWWKLLLNLRVGASVAEPKR